MANINFGLLDTQYPEKLANAFVRSPEQQNANMLQVMQMQQLMDQREQAQYALGKSRREDADLLEFGNAIKALGPDPDPLAIAQVFIKHPKLEYQLKGFELQRQAQADKGYRNLGPMGAPAAPPAVAPAPGSPAVGYEFAADMMANRAVLPSFGDNKLAATVAAPAAPAAPRTRESRIAEIQPRLALLRPFTKDNPQAKSEYDMLLDEVKELRKPQVMAPGSVLDIPGVDRVTAPQLPQQPRQVNLAADLLIPGPNGTMIPNQALIKVKEGLRPTGTTVNVLPGPKVEGEYGKKFGGLAAEDDAKLLGAARSAPKMAENANETLRLLELPTITGSGADIRLALAKAYSLLGDTDQQSIVNTENLIKSTGAATLASIKDAGLGTGQGFTDKDLKFLQGVTGGTIALSEKTLKDFARIQHEAAVKIAAMWETRKKNIPKSALEGTGIDKESISIAPIRGKANAPEVWVRDASGKLVKQ